MVCDCPYQVGQQGGESYSIEFRNAHLGVNLKGKAGSNSHRSQDTSNV